MSIARVIANTVVVALVVLLVPQVFAGDGIVGTWNLVSFSTENSETGEITHPYGDHPHGRLTYTPGGHMMAILTVEGRKRLGVNRFAGSVDDQADAYKSMNAYAGTYTLTDTDVVHLSSTLFHFKADTHGGYDASEDEIPVHRKHGCCPGEGSAF